MHCNVPVLGSDRNDMHDVLTYIHMIVIVTVLRPLPASGTFQNVLLYLASILRK